MSMYDAPIGPKTFNAALEAGEINYGPMTFSDAFEADPEGIAVKYPEQTKGLVDAMTKPSVGEQLISGMSKVGKAVANIFKAIGHIFALVFTLGLNSSVRRNASDFFYGTTKVADHEAIKTRAAALEAAKDEDGNLPQRVKDSDLNAELAKLAEKKRRREEPTIVEQASDVVVDVASKTQKAVKENPMTAATVLGGIALAGLAVIGLAKR